MSWKMKEKHGRQQRAKREYTSLRRTKLITKKINLQLNYLHIHSTFPNNLTESDHYVRQKSNELVVMTTCQDVAEG